MRQSRFREEEIIAILTEQELTYPPYLDHSKHLQTAWTLATENCAGGNVLIAFHTWMRHELLRGISPRPLRGNNDVGLPIGNS